MAIPLIFDRGFKPDSISLPGKPKIDIRPDLSAISYGNFKFPPAVRSTAKVAPIYDDSGRMTKYIKVTISIEFYLFTGFIGPSFNNIYERPVPDFSGLPDSVNSGVDSVDTYMRWVMSELSTPRQRLHFLVQGLGNLVVFGSGGDDEFLSSSWKGYTTIDTDSGPKPRIISWRPLTNKVCHIIWEAETSIAACQDSLEWKPSKVTGLIGSDPLPVYISQLSFSMTTEIDHRGLTIRTIDGKLEIPITYHGGELIPDTTDHTNLLLQKVLSDLFPIQARFHRSQTYKRSEDRKTMEFRIIDSEIPSEEAYGEGCINENVTLSMSNFEQYVFSRWKCSLSGTIELAAGFPKTYAFDEIARLFRRYVYPQTVVKTRRRNNTSEPVEQGDPKNTSKTTDLKPILMNVDIKDEIFSRRVGFNIVWAIAGSLEEVFNGIKMFEATRPVSEAPVDSWLKNNEEAWNSWKTSMSRKLHGRGYHKVDFNIGNDILVSLCQPVDFTKQDPFTIPDPIEEPSKVNRASVKDISKTPPGHDYWIDYQPYFEIEVMENTCYHAPLGPYQQPQESPRVPLEITTSTSFGSVPGTPSSPDPQQEVLTHSLREPVYLLKFSGYAIRLNYPIPPPSISLVGGRPLKRVGNSRYKPILLGSGVDIVSGQTYQLHALLWDKTYVLSSPPADVKIASDGHKDIYV